MSAKITIQNTGPKVIVEEQRIKVVYGAKRGVPGLPGSPNTFLELTDTPGSYDGHAGDLIKVSLTEDGLEFSSTSVASAFKDLTDTPASYTGNKGKVPVVNSAEEGLAFYNMDASRYATSDTGSDAYTVTLTPVPGAYFAGMIVRFKADVANTGACSLDVNSLGAKSIKLDDGSDPGDGYIQAGSVVTVVYDGTNFLLVTPGLKSHLSDYPNHGNLKNKIINGNFDIWQRGTSFTATGYGADRWWIVRGANGTLTDSRETYNGRHVYRITTATAPISDNYLIQGFESSVFNSLKGKKVTVSFKARRSAQALTHSSVLLKKTALESSAHSGTVIGARTITSEVTEAEHTFSFTTEMPDVTDTNQGLQLVFQAIPDINTVGAWVEIWDVQLEEGEIDTSFENRPIGLEQLFCDRYAQAFTVRSINGTIWVPFRTVMRAAPTVTPSAGTAGNITPYGFTLTHNAEAAIDIFASAEL